MPIVQMVLLGFIVFATITLFYFVPVGMWIQGIVSLGIGRIRIVDLIRICLLYTSPSPRDQCLSRMPSSA